MYLNKKIYEFFSIVLLIKFFITFNLFIILLSCSQISTLKNSHMPKSISFQKSVKLPFIPDKICYCPFSKTFLLLNKNENIINRTNKNGKILQKIGDFGFGKNQFINISDITIDSFGNLFVVDKISNKVVKYDEMGQFVNSVTFFELTEPVLINVKDNGDLILYDSPTNEIYCFDNRSRLRYNFGKFIFNYPAQIMSSNQANYILDIGNNNIIVFDDFGGIITTIDAKNNLVDIYTTQDILYYIDSSNDIFCYKIAGNIKYKLDSLTNLIPISKPKLIIIYEKKIGIVDKNTLYIFQLTFK